MILDAIRLFAIGTLLAGSAIPSLAEGPQGAPAPVERPKSVASSTGESRDAGRSRRVELPFPLQFRSPESEPPAPAPRDTAGPHPFRETLLKRASLAAPAGTRGLRLSRSSDFS